MKLQFKMNYLHKIYHRYHKALRNEKTQILNEFCKVCAYNRKYALRLINAPLKSKKSIPKTRKPNYKYSPETIDILAQIWKAAGFIWSKRLKAIIHLWLPWSKKHFRISKEIEKQLLSISSSTMDRRLKHKKYLSKIKIYGRTKPGSLLKHQIPIKTDNWDIDTCGFLEIDLVSHSGSSASGTFIYSLNTTDIKSTWTDTRAILGKSQIATFKALREIEDSLPFPLKGIDPDNDSAFINYHLYNYCKKHDIQFTRSRPYKKDDNAHIEQKNWTNVRKIFGYVRYDSIEALNSMNDLYRNELRWFLNFFIPSVQLIKKTRIGSRYKRIYDKPKTPFQRLCESKDADPKKLKELKKSFLSLDPFELSKTIDKKLDKIFKMATNINDLKD